MHMSCAVVGYSISIANDVFAMPSLFNLVTRWSRHDCQSSVLGVNIDGLVCQWECRLLIPAALIDHMPPLLCLSLATRFDSEYLVFVFLIRSYCSQLRSHGVWTVQYAKRHLLRDACCDLGTSCDQSYVYWSRLRCVILAKNFVIRCLHNRGTGTMTCAAVEFFDFSDGFACFATFWLRAVDELREWWSFFVCMAVVVI